MSNNGTDTRRSFMLAAGIGLGWWAGKELLGRMRERTLRGQVALITGGSRGLGFLLAREFAREGCSIAICARDVDELARAQEMLTRGGADVFSAQCDVSDEAQVVRMAEQVMDHFGRIDILVNNAGIIQVGPVEAMTAQDFEDAMKVNFWGVLYPTLAVLPQMERRESGRIVNITSIGGKISVPHLLPYSCAKFAMVGLSEGLRAELAEKGITVTTIVPGLMRTGSHVNAYVKGDREAEYKLFGLAATLPGVSMNAERAARQIVQATRRGEAERVIGLPAKVGTTVHCLFPGATCDLLGMVNRALPDADGSADQAEAVRGMEVKERVERSPMTMLMGLGEKAARDLNQNPGPRAVPPG